MTLQNRVTAFGEIVAEPARGLMMGNRGGRLHDPATRRLLPRRWASKAWICCVTEFRDRRRSVMGAGYTELFFLDEVTALAAGHRPCFECRRKSANQFASLAADSPKADRMRAPEMDLILHRQRLDGRVKRLHVQSIDTLPDGAIIVLDESNPPVLWAIRAERLLQWTMQGYRRNRPRPAGGMVSVATPPMMLAALSAGYRPIWHPSSG